MFDTCAEHDGAQQMVEEHRRDKSLMLALDIACCSFKWINSSDYKLKTDTVAVTKTWKFFQQHLT